MSKKKGFDAFLVPESSMYRVEPGEYDLQLSSPTLGPNDVIAIQEGEGEIRDDKMIIHEPCDVWIPEGTTLFPSVSDIVGGIVGLVKPKKTSFRIAISPTSGSRGTSFKVAVAGVQKNNKVNIKVTKKSIISGRLNDPLLAATVGNGRTSFSGDELIRDMKLKPGVHTMYIYGEERLRGFNRYTKSVPVRISVRQTAAPTISGGDFKVTVRPSKGGPKNRFLFIVYNAKGGREIQLNISKPGGGRFNDWLIGKTKGRGVGTTTPVYVNGSVIASKVGIKEGSARTLMVYAEEIYRGKNRYTNSVPLVFGVPRSAPGPSPDVTPTPSSGDNFRMTITPTEGGVNDRFKIRVFGSPSNARKIRLCTSRLPPGPYDDPTFATMPGNGTKYVTGADLLRGHPIMTRMPGPDTVKVYARADIPKTLRDIFGIDKFTKPATSVTVYPDEEPMPEPDYDPTPTPTPVTPRCKEGYRRSPQSCPDGKTIYREVCRGGKWVPSSETCREDEGVPPEHKPTPAPIPAVCADGTQSADGKMVCSGGVWVPIEAAPAEREFLTREEALARMRMGMPCYVKSTLPLLNLLPGLPYIEWLPLPPFCVIKADP